MKYGPFDDFLRPTGHEVELTPEDLEEIEQLKIRAKKDFRRKNEISGNGIAILK
jgi:hypothetical protein